MSDTVARVRAALGDLHDRLEALPLAKRVATSSVGRGEYRVLLTQLLALHETLEGALSDAGEPLFEPRMARVAALRADLGLLGGPDPGGVLPATEELVARVRARAAESRSLLGALYIVEGSRMGSRFLAKAVARSLGVTAQPGAGVDYHLDAADDQPAHWKRFKETLAALPLSEAESAAVAESAAETMQGLYDIYEAVPEGVS